VINLSPDKARVFIEAFRALKPGGRLMVSDIVLLKRLPTQVQKSVEAYIGCLSGAIMKEKYLNLIRKAGFQDVKIIEAARFPVEYMANDPTAKAAIKKTKVPARTARSIADAIESVKVYGLKPN
jgi:arsenite methyltransferase